MLDRTWDPPFYQEAQKLPYIPRESDIDAHSRLAQRRLPFCRR
ncbi:MAG: hypothetical protein ACOC6N_01385 [archaeon]